MCVAGRREKPEIAKRIVLHECVPGCPYVGMVLVGVWAVVGG